MCNARFLKQIVLVPNNFGEAILIFSSGIVTNFYISDTSFLKQKELCILIYLKVIYFIIT